MAEGVQIGNLSIPIAKGDKGDAGQISSLQVTMLASTAEPTVTNNGTTTNAQYVLGIPRGTSVTSVTLNDDGEMIVALSDGTSSNLGVVQADSVVGVEIDEEFNLIVTLTSGTEINAGNLEDELEAIIGDYLEDYSTTAEIAENYYDKDTIDSTFYTKTATDGKYSLITETGNKIDLSINSTTYVVTLTLKDKNNNTLSTGTIDLPLESVVVSGSYNSTTKKIVLTLQGGSTIEFSVADLVAGLQSEITSSNKLSADLVDDTSTTNKFVTSTEKTTWNAKVGTTDYATSSTGGVIKASTTYGLDMDNGDLRTKIWSTTGGHTFNDREFIGYKTLMNIFDGKLANSSSAGTLRTANCLNVYGSGTDMGKVYCGSLSVDQIFGTSSDYNNCFISAYSLKNVINSKIGDIDSALDAINGEVI